MKKRNKKPTFKRIDMKGHESGVFVVTSYSHSERGRTFWNTKCKSCGDKFKADGNRLRRNHYKTCNLCGLDDVQGYEVEPPKLF